MDSRDRKLLVEISVMYYLEGKTQTEIAREMFMSRPKVSRLLKKARDMNIVEIKINYENDDYNRLIKQIKHRFGVDNVVLIKTLSSEEETIKEIGRVAANELKYHLRDDINIGMSWGRTVRSMVDAFKPKNLHNIKVVELFGAVELGENTQEFLSIGYEFSQKVNGTFFPLPAPLYIDDEPTRKILMDNQVIQSTLDMINKCDLLITSLGAVTSNQPQRIWDAHVDEKSRKELIDLGVEGFICAHFFDQDGKFINHPINDHVIGIDKDTVLNKKLMLVAGGKTKCKAIYSVLKGGLVNTLVSDDKTMRKILDADIKARGEIV